MRKKVTSKLLDNDGSAEKLYHLNDQTMCAVAGMTADALILVNNARVTAQRYLKTYNEEIPCELLIKSLCDVKQGYTQHGGLRPFGVSFIYAGHDDRNAFQLFTSNPRVIIVVGRRPPLAPTMQQHRLCLRKITGMKSRSRRRVSWPLRFFPRPSIAAT